VSSNHGRPDNPFQDWGRDTTWAKITRTVHGKGQRAQSKDQRPKSSEQSTGRASVLSPRTSVLICVLMDSHRRHVCADGHTRTATNVLCVTVTDSHRTPRTSCVCWQTPTDLLCVLNRQPTWAKITRTVNGKGQRADMCTDRQPQTSSTYVLCVLADTHGRPVCTEQTAHRADMCTDGQPQTSSTDVLCVMTDTHRRPVQPTWAKIIRTVHGKGQQAQSKDQRADIVLSPRTSVLTCVLMDSHRRYVCADGHTRTATNVLCVVMDSHIRSVCAGGHPRTSSTDVLCVLADTHGRPVCTEQTAHSTGRVSVLSPRTNVLICVLMDSHGRPMCADGNTRTHTDSHGRPVCAGRHPRTSCVY
ncbi:unnamed protein product, partial [Brassica rapa]